MKDTTTDDVKQLAPTEGYDVLDHPDYVQLTREAYYESVVDDEKYLWPDLTTETKL